MIPTIYDLAEAILENAAELVFCCGAKGIRTPDLLDANETVPQLTGLGTVDTASNAQVRWLTGLGTVGLAS
jgi:hypothetical protein